MLTLIRAEVASKVNTRHARDIEVTALGEKAQTASNTEAVIQPLVGDLQNSPIRPQYLGTGLE